LSEVAVAVLALTVWGPMVSVGNRTLKWNKYRPPTMNYTAVSLCTWN